MRNGLIAAAALSLLGGCDALEDLADGVEAPKASLNRVDLIKAPSTRQLIAWQCHTFLGAGACANLGYANSPGPNQLTYSFDLVFDLRNPNPDLPIPLVEALVGMRVFDLQDNLGAACISFCDPEDEACLPELNAEGACAVDEAQDVQGPNDLIPTVDDLVDLADQIANGTADQDNGDWRVIPGGGKTEAHLQFDLSADVMLSLADLLLEDALNDVIDGKNVSVEVPYTTEGTVFFDVPKLGRHATGFGPWDDSWLLE